jgi:hypothetical protein
MEAACTTETCATSPTTTWCNNTRTELTSSRGIDCRYCNFVLICCGEDTDKQQDISQLERQKYMDINSRKE